MRDPTYYCVRAYRDRRGRLFEVELRHPWCATAREARGLARRLGPSHALAIAYAFEGLPEYGVYGEPRVLCRHGALAHLEAA